MSARARPPMGIGIVGCGVISSEYALELKKYPFLKLLACTDLEQSRARKLAEDYAIPSVDRKSVV